MLTEPDGRPVDGAAGAVGVTAVGVNAVGMDGVPAVGAAGVPVVITELAAGVVGVPVAATELAAGMPGVPVAATELAVGTTGVPVATTELAVITVPMVPAAVTELVRSQVAVMDILVRMDRVNRIVLKHAVPGGQRAQHRMQQLIKNAIQARLYVAVKLTAIKWIQRAIGTPDMQEEQGRNVVLMVRCRILPIFHQHQAVSMRVVQLKVLVGMDARGSIPVNQCVAAGCPVTG